MPPPATERDIKRGDKEEGEVEEEHEEDEEE